MKIENPLAQILTPREFWDYLLKHGNRAIVFDNPACVGVKCNIVRMDRANPAYPWKITISTTRRTAVQADDYRKAYYLIPEEAFDNPLKQADNVGNYNEWSDLRVYFWSAGYKTGIAPLELRLDRTKQWGRWVVNKDGHVYDYGQAADPTQRRYIYPAEFPLTYGPKSYATQLERIFLGG